LIGPDKVMEERGEEDWRDEVDGFIGRWGIDCTVW
jgi:hypothetical protein